MASAGDTGGGGKGGRKSLNAELNLVPFIDLFSMIIIFLLSTAVWDELASVKINLGSTGQGQQIEQEVKKVTSEVKITITEKAIQFTERGQSRSMSYDAEGPNDFKELEDFFANVRSRYPDKRDMLVMAADKAPYEILVAVLDRALQQKFDEMVVSGIGGE